MLAHLWVLVDERDVRLEAGDVLAAVLALLLLLGVRLALVVPHLEKVLEGYVAHGALEMASLSPVRQHCLFNIDMGHLTSTWLTQYAVEG